nr:hypothetical protein [Tanacetum cinerariifolium]
MGNENTQITKLIYGVTFNCEADDFSELKKITALLAKAFNRRKFYCKPTNNNLRTLSSSQSANKKQEFVKTDNKRVEKKDDEKKRDMSRVKCYNCKKKGHFAKDCKKTKVKDYEYYKTKMLLAKKHKDEQVLLAEDQAWMESRSDSDQEINANMVFMAQIKKVLSDSEASSSSADEKISKEIFLQSHLTLNNSNVSTVFCCCSRHVNTARPKALINRRNRVKDVQASACWVWKSVKPNSASIILKRYDYVDVRGRSRSVMAWVPKKD